MKSATSSTSQHSGRTPVETDPGITGGWKFNRLKFEADTLVLLVHGMNCSPETLKVLTNKVQEELPTAEFRIPALPFAWHRRFDLDKVSESIAHALGEVIQGGTSSLSFSSGTVPAVCLCSPSTCTSKRHQILLFSRIPNKKLVLIAPITRGWTYPHHLPPLEKLRWLAGLKLSPVLRACNPRGRASSEGKRCLCGYSSCSAVRLSSSGCDSAGWPARRGRQFISWWVRSTRSSRGATWLTRWSMGSMSIITKCLIRTTRRS